MRLQDSVTLLQAPGGGLQPAAYVVGVPTASSSSSQQLGRLPQLEQLLQAIQRRRQKPVLLLLDAAHQLQACEPTAVAAGDGSGQQQQQAALQLCQQLAAAHGLQLQVLQQEPAQAAAAASSSGRLATRLLGAAGRAAGAAAVAVLDAVEGAAAATAAAIAAAEAEGVDATADLPDVGMRPRCGADAVAQRTCCMSQPHTPHARTHVPCTSLPAHARNDTTAACAPRPHAALQHAPGGLE